MVTEEIVVIHLERQTRLDMDLPHAQRLAEAWMTARDDALRPWTVLTFTNAAASAIEDLFRADPAGARSAETAARILPVDRCAVTEVRIGLPGEGDAELRVDVAGDPPTYAYSLPQEAARRFRSLGLWCDEPVMDDTVLFAPDRYGEQMLGWDDIYSTEEWSLLDRARRMHLAVSRPVCRLDLSTLQAIARVFADSRFAIDNQDL